MHPSEPAHPAVSLEAPSASPAEGAARQRAPSVPRPFGVGFLLAALAAVSIVKPFWVQVFLGAALAAALVPVHAMLLKLVRGRVGLASALATLLLLAVVLAPLASLLAYGANEVSQGLQWAQESLRPEHLAAMYNGHMPEGIRSLIGKGLNMAHLSADDVDRYAGQALEVAQQVTPGIFGASLGALGGLLLVLISCFIFLSDGPALLALLMESSPLQQKQTKQLIEDFHAVASGSLIGMVFTATGQAVVLTAGFAAAGLSHLFFWGVLSFVSAFVPLVGSMLVWLPVSVGLIALEGAGKGLGILAWSFVSINVVDGLLKPMVMGNKITLHGGVMFLGMLGGISMLGPVGVIAGPLIMTFFVSFLRMYRRDYQQMVSER